jgi:hypothetical protein
MYRWTRLGCVLLLGATFGACNAVDSATDLNPEGPPQVRQIFMSEQITEGTVVRSVKAIAFGEHPDFTAQFPGDDGSVETAVASPSQRLRIVVDELLIGNYLEHIQCRNGTYQAVPEGATPDDIARCSVAADLLPTSCVGDYAVCFDADGLPIGVMDTDENGSADDTRFIDGALSIVCTSREGNVDSVAPLNLTDTFWQPSGNQQVPAAGGFDAIGPAIIVAPLYGLPTNSICGLAFGEDVVDKDHERICASEGGSIDTACEPGNLDPIAFGTEILATEGSDPQPDAPAVAATPGTAQVITILMNTTIAETPTGITVSHDGVDDAITVARDSMNLDTLEITVTGGFVAGATYTVDYSGLTDYFGVAIPAGGTSSFTFTTAP